MNSLSLSLVSTGCSAYGDFEMDEEALSKLDHRLQLHFEMNVVHEESCSLLFVVRLRLCLMLMLMLMMCIFALFSFSIIYGHTRSSFRLEQYEYLSAAANARFTHSARQRSRRFPCETSLYGAQPLPFRAHPGGIPVLTLVNILFSNWTVSQTSQ